MRPVSQGFRIYAAGRDHGHSSRGLGWPEQDSFPDYLSTLESLTYGMWVLMVSGVLGFVDYQGKEIGFLEKKKEEEEEEEDEVVLTG